MPIYRNILKKALEITWKNPSLWLFGLFAAILGAGGEIEVLRQYATLEQGGKGLIKDIFSSLFNGQAWVFIKDALVALNSAPATFLTGIFLLMLMLAVIVAVIWITIVSLTALINGTLDAAKNNQSKLKKNFGSGLAKFWPVLGFNAVMQVGLWLLAFEMFNLTKTLANIPIAFVALFLIYIAAIILISFITKYAILESVLENQTFGRSWTGAIKLFRDNWFISLEFAILMFIVFWGANLLLANISNLVFFFFIQVFYQFPLVITLIGSLASIVFVLFEILLAVFHWAAWILFFELLYSKKPIISRLILGWKKLVS